jgi:ectoine hydroxylase-related dioxygenase (phytanoyl-CoA dioxygenase family)
MDDVQKYLFDVNGYLVIENALTPAEVAALNEAIDNCQDRIVWKANEHSLAHGAKSLEGAKARGDLREMLTWPKPWCQPFRDLLVHPSVTPVLLELLRDGFRLDHLYGIVMSGDTEGFVMHSGGTTDDLTFFYQFHNGRMRCGVVVVSFQLTDVNEGDGGLACIPGSHKANYPVPREIARLETDIGGVRQITAKAGSAIIFTEALTHGTLPWRAAHERRSVLYKYAPGALVMLPHPPEGTADCLEELTPAQRAVLEPPYTPFDPRRPKIAGLR